MTTTEFRLFPKALVLTNTHHFAGTDIMARSLAAGLEANGFDTSIANVYDKDSQAMVQALLDPETALIITTGTLPLLVRINDQPIWRAIPATTQFVTYIIDQWPYDHVRVEPFRQFMADWEAKAPNLHIASLEYNNAKLIGDRAYYFPTGAYGAPRRTAPKHYPDRLMIWASVKTELHVTPVHDEFEPTLRDNNHWGFDEDRIRRIGEAVRHTATTHSLTAFAEAGKPVIGICNGFQILCESHLLPGALIRNQSLQFRCEWVHLRREGGSTPWADGIKDGEVIRVPISHGEGNYYADNKTLDELELRGRVVFRYCDESGEVTPSANPNGSSRNIAGIINGRGNVLGMMPHPERAGEALVGGSDGNRMWESMIGQAVAVLG